MATCHSTAPSADTTDWQEIAGLYGELLRYEPSAVIEANRAVAVAMAEGPEAAWRSSIRWPPELSWRSGHNCTSLEPTCWPV